MLLERFAIVLTEAENGACFEVQEIARPDVREKRVAYYKAAYPKRTFEAVRLSNETTTVEKPVPVPPTLEVLARALFDTDERVGIDIMQRAGGKEVPGYTGRFGGMPRVPTTQQYFDRAWEKDINGWRTDAVKRAADVLLALKEKV